MKRRRGRRRKLRVANKIRFAFSLTLIIGVIFILSFSVKAIFNKEDKNKVAPKVEKSTCSIKDSEVKTKSKSEKEKSLKSNVKEAEETPIFKDKEVIEKKKDSGNKSYNFKGIFKDSLFIGDSITDSLSAYEVLDERNVIAKLGLTAVGAQKEVINIGEGNFSKVYILFGMNDILMGISDEKFTQNYMDLIHIIQKKLPNADIYVQSILPVSPKVQNKKPALNNLKIKEFNSALVRMCKDEGINYINLRPILKGKENLFEPDGIHLKYAFYKQWLNYIINNNSQQ